MMGDFNMTMTELQLQMGSWDLPFRVLPTRGGRPTRRSQRGGDPTPAIDFITFCGETQAAVPPAKVLDHWDISDHFPVIADLPGLTRVPDRGAIPPPPSTLGRLIVVEEKNIKHKVASSNYWQPLADSLEDEVAEALEHTQAHEETDTTQPHRDPARWYGQEIHGLHAILWLMNWISTRKWGGQPHQEWQQDLG